MSPMPVAPGDRWKAFRAHVHALWPRAPLLPGVPFVGWALISLARGQRRWEILLLGLFGLVMPYVGPRSKKLYLGIMPAGLVAVMYDAMGLVKNVGLRPERVHLCDLRALEMRWFGISIGDRTTTVHDWLQTHATLPLDVFFSVPYAIFLEAFVLFAVFLYFKNYPAMRRFTWGFFVLNLMTFITYHVYPAAPPWYYHAHGCVADLSARASAGPNLARVDQWLGVRYFAAFYGRSSDVFGAVPSLHVAYPLLIVLQGWPVFASLRRARLLQWPLRAMSLSFLLWMCTAAVYLDHHWVIDVVVGLSYGIVAFVAVRAVATFRAPPDFVSDRVSVADSLEK